MKNASLLVTCLLLVGCAQAPAQPTPPTLDIGNAQCSRCRMSIDDGKFAAARQVGITVTVYDDMGELFEDRLQHPADEQESLWVRDYQTEKWLDARSALYLESDRIRSPMAYGIIAAPTPTHASALMARFPGQLRDFASMQARFETNTGGR